MIPTYKSRHPMFKFPQPIIDTLSRCIHNIHIYLHMHQSTKGMVWNLKHLLPCCYPRTTFFQISYIFIECAINPTEWYIYYEGKGKSSTSNLSLTLGSNSTSCFYATWRMTFFHIILYISNMCKKFYRKMYPLPMHKAQFQGVKGLLVYTWINNFFEIPL